jgi:lipopolysaccharide heptosyltransferase I
MLEPRKILILRLSSLGDILHTLPAFQSLRTAFPEARIDWLVERQLAFLLGAVEGIDEVIPIDTRAFRGKLTGPGNWRRLVDPIRMLRDRTYGLSVDFQGLLKTAFLTLAGGATTRAGFPKDLVRERPAHWFYNVHARKPGSPIHITRMNLLVAEAAGASPGMQRVRLRAPDDDIQAIENQLRIDQLSGFIIINPGGGWPTKRWKADRFGELAATIQKKLGLRVIVVTGPGEEPLYAEMADQCRAHPPLHYPVSFLQLIPLFERAKLVIAGDTGPMHLACALETPVVGIMGPTSPVRNGPWSERDEVVVHRLPCSYCHGRSCPTRNECMDISADEVFAAVERRLGKTP